MGNGFKWIEHHCSTSSGLQLLAWQFPSRCPQEHESKRLASLTPVWPGLAKGRSRHSQPESACEPSKGGAGGIKHQAVRYMVYEYLIVHVCWPSCRHLALMRQVKTSSLSRRLCHGLSTH